VKNELETFFDEHSVPLVGQRTKENKDKRYEARPLVVVYYGVDFSFDYRVNTQIWRKKVLNVANDMKDVTFAISNEEDFTEELKRVKLDDSPEEVNVIIYDDDDRRYPMEPDDEFDEEVLTEFVEKYLAGKLKPMYKSEKTPKKNKGPVKVVTANTFDEIVMDETRDIMIEFYAPWCGHCKKLTPVYKKLAKKFKDNDGVVIAKMDATANDIPNNIYKAEGFPTIYWAPAGSKKKPSKYSGGRELDDLVEYVEENSTKLKLEKDEL
jgi:protein disulfide-isomerase A4